MESQEELSLSEKRNEEVGEAGKKQELTVAASLSATHHVHAAEAHRPRVAECLQQSEAGRWDKIHYSSVFT